MMTNLFNIFDPTTSVLLSLNWMFILMPLMYMRSPFWLIKSRWVSAVTIIIKNLNNEMKSIMKKKIYSVTFISLFMMFSMTNFVSLNSFIFTTSSHMSVNLSMSLPLWVSFMMIGWIFNPNHMLAHQVPNSTPYSLMPLMVLIEMISNIIRPGTLSVRMAANMIAGHLILALISDSGFNLSYLLSTILIILQSSLVMLEMAVAVIQSYVFVILLTLYSQEV